VTFTDMLTCASSNLVVHFTVPLSLVWSTVMVRCPLCICVSFLIYITNVRALEISPFEWWKCGIRILSRSGFRREACRWGSICSEHTCFLVQKRAIQKSMPMMVCGAQKWYWQAPAFAGPIEYFRLFFAEFVVTLLLGESNLYFHQYYIQQGT
jgi:hypothetical protein